MILNNHTLYYNLDNGWLVIGTGAAVPIGIGYCISTSNESLYDIDIIKMIC